eukprot:gb/GEZN01014782.1/.p1 GENE.gb/GEZN01014782.1/~~gb/GEZN01014782.1/.p1  ORF type:complete len:224 (+),score=8.10 gb/GEZN01014782.1/:118-789(+)
MPGYFDRNKPNTVILKISRGSCLTAQNLLTIFGVALIDAVFVEPRYPHVGYLQCADSGVADAICARGRRRYSRQGVVLDILSVERTQPRVDKNAWWKYSVALVLVVLAIPLVYIRWGASLKQQLVPLLVRAPYGLAVLAPFSGWVVFVLAFAIWFWSLQHLYILFFPVGLCGQRHSKQARMKQRERVLAINRESKKALHALHHRAPALVHRDLAKLSSSMHIS